MTAEASSNATDAAPDRRRAAYVAAFALLALIELPLLAFLFDPLAINDDDPAWLKVRAVLREGVPFCMFAIVAFALLAIPSRRTIFKEFRRGDDGRAWAGLAAANISIFAVLIFATLKFNQIGSLAAAPPWPLFALWTLSVFSLYAIIAHAFLPVRRWRSFVSDNRLSIGLTLSAAALIETAAAFSRQSWNILSEATFHSVAVLLRTYESGVVVDSATRTLGVGDFLIFIAPSCSGYEGIGLVLTFLAIYLYVFRKDLRFPNVLMVLPAGALAIWLLNIVRITLLVSLGAHVSPEIALTGFHSQAGWMMFLAVTIGVMAAAHHVPFFRLSIAEDRTAPSIAYREALALLAPFLAMTAASIVGAAFSGEGHWLYVLRVIAVGGAIIHGWRYYRRLEWRKVGWTPLLLGLGVGVAWIATDPGRDQPSALGGWLPTLPPAAFAAWMTLRAAGTILFAPFAEELAFRGYLHRKLIARNFETVAEGAFSWKGFLISSALFGLMHERWLSGALAGAVFAFALYRSGKITGAIIAHIAANALIALWAIAFAQWSLL